MIFVTPGDPKGIGAEVAWKALDAIEHPVVLVGDEKAINKARPKNARAFVVEPGGKGPIEVRAIRYAVVELLKGKGRALVTGPIHKASLVEQGFRFRGHTGFIASICKVKKPVMAFVGGKVRVALVTTHLPLRNVPDAITHDAVLHTIRTAHDALTDQLGIPTPRILVCGLNPHAGEEGVLGHEEAEIIGPACDVARADGLKVEGPMSAETAFRVAKDGKADLVVAMYHDQGLVPLKALDFGNTVNWTLGLPIIRTSVDHGTARDIAGTGKADPSSMRAALQLAERLMSKK